LRRPFVLTVPGRGTGQPRVHRATGLQPAGHRRSLYPGPRDERSRAEAGPRPDQLGTLAPRHVGPSERPGMNGPDLIVEATETGAVVNDASAELTRRVRQLFDPPRDGIPGRVGLEIELF